MPAGPFTVVDAAIAAILDSSINITGDTFVAVLITAAHSADVTDTAWADISASEATGTGYTSGGDVISPLSVDTTDPDMPAVEGADALWTPATVSAKYVYVVRRAGGSLVSGDLIFGFMDLNEAGGNLSAVGADFSVAWGAGGMFTMARATP